MAAVVEALRGDWLTQGPSVTAFEEQLAAACGAPYAVAFSSGTAALHAACFAAGVGPGDEVVTSAITFAASANCAAYVGATPRFADIDPATLNVSVGDGRGGADRAHARGHPRQLHRAAGAGRRAARGPRSRRRADRGRRARDRRPPPRRTGRRRPARRHDDPVLVPPGQDRHHGRGRRDHAALAGAAREAARLPLARDDQGPRAARAPRRGRLVHGAAGARVQLPHHGPAVRARQLPAGQARAFRRRSQRDRRPLPGRARRRGRAAAGRA